MGVRVPDERLDELEWIAKRAVELRTLAPRPPISPEDLAALVADLRAARADNQRLREELAYAESCRDDMHAWGVRAEATNRKLRAETERLRAGRS